jgi:hypothetical protein
MALILALAVLYGLVFFRQPLYSDSLAYYRMSVDFLHGRPSDFYWPLGWPLMMAGVQYVLGESQWVVKAFSFVLVLLTLWIQLVMVWKVLPLQVSSRRRGAAYGIVVANALFLLYHANFAFTDVPIALFGTLLAYALLFSNLTASTIAPALLSALMTIVRFGSFLLLPAILVYGRLFRRAPLRLLVLSAALSVFSVLIAVAYVSMSSGGLVLLNTANSDNLFYGNHKRTPLYETWRWGSHASAEKDAATQALVKKYHLGNRNSVQYHDAMGKEARSQIARSPAQFLIRCLTRASVLLAFDSSIGGSEFKSGHRLAGFVLLVTMLLVSLVTKFAAAVGVFGSNWSSRHLIWVILLALGLPHIVAFAHPSYFQMFMSTVVPVAAVATLQAESSVLRKRLPQLAVTIFLVVASHAAFAYYMWRSRF